VSKGRSALEWATSVLSKEATIMTRRSSILLCLTVAFAALAVPRAALAEKRIVVLDIEGAPSPRLRDTVAALIRVRHQVISDTKYKSAAERIGAKGLEAGDVARVAQAVEADGVLTGAISRQANRRYLLVLRLRAGADGKPVKKFTLWLDSPRLSPQLKSQLSARLLTAIDGLPLIEGARSRPPDRAGAGAAAGKGFQESLEVADEEFNENETLEAEDESGSAVQGSGGDASGMRSSADPGGRDGPGGVDWRAYAFASAASVHVGGSLVVRDLTFTTTRDFPQAPQGYDGPLAPGLYASGEIYPLGFLRGRHRVLTMFGMGFEVDRVIGLQTAIDSGIMDILAPTTQMRYSVGLRARYNILGNPSLPTIKLGFGLGRLSFEVNRDDVPLGVVLDVPNTAYSYWEPALSVHVPVARRVALTAAGTFLFITDAGEVQAPEQYGQALVKGFTAGLGMDVLATRGLLVRLSGAYTAVNFEFSGTGAQTNGRDGDNTTQDVDGAHDRYLSGALTLGYVF
jgi:hypothetical protein